MHTASFDGSIRRELASGFSNPAAKRILVATDRASVGDPGKSLAAVRNSLRTLLVVMLGCMSFGGLLEAASAIPICTSPQPVASPAPSSPASGAVISAGNTSVTLTFPGVETANLSVTRNGAAFFSESINAASATIPGVTAGTYVVSVLNTGIPLYCHYWIASSMSFSVVEEAPGAPTSVSATAGVRQASVAFAAPTDNGGTAIKSYTATSNPGGQTASGTGSPLTVTGLANGGTYTFTVTAVNATGTSAASSPSNSVTLPAPPGAPTNVSAASGNGQATVSFAAPSSNGGAAISSYTVTSNPGGVSASSAGSPIVVPGLSDGVEYTFTVSATNIAGVGAVSAPSNTAVPDATPTVAVGETGGSFSIASSGAATYSIPLQVPPGTGGMEPKLALNYNSQAGNGLVGVGWSLTGLSAISRCPQTVEQDGVSANGSVNFNASDRFCLDGKRLVLVAGAYGANGAEYRTEIDSFSRINSYGVAGSAPANSNPAYFTVQSKSGLTLEFGNTTDSHVVAQGRTDGSVQVWAVDKITDSAGNYLTVTYTTDATNGQYYPSRIDYTGNGTTAPNASVQFKYAQRSDVVPTFLAGSRSQLTVLLSSISTFVGTEAVLQYNISYQTSSYTSRPVVATIQECAISAPAACKPPVAFSSITSAAPALGEISNASISTYCTCVLDYVMDVNGDGKSDFVRLWQNGSLTYADVWESNGTGFVEVSNQPIGNWSSAFWYYVMDVNGDGKSDLVRVYQNGTLMYADVWVANASGTGFTEISNAAIGSYCTCFKMYVMDVNGDGRSDLVKIWQNGSLEYADVWASNGTGFTELSNSSIGTWCTCIQEFVMDVNGDGKADIVRLWQNGSYTYADIWLANGASFTEVSNLPIGPFSTGFQYLVMDVNGDGKQDLVRLWQNGTLANADVWASTGTSFVEISNNSVGNWCTCIQEFSAMDVNGDGKSDLVRLWYTSSQTYADIWVSNGTGFNEVSNNAIGAYSTGFLYYVGDINGDGKNDLIRIYQNGTQEYADVWVALGTGNPDALAGVTDSLGAKTNVSYLPLTNSSLYQKGSGATYPAADIEIAMYAVSSVQKSNGLGGFVTENYQYGGLRTDFGGRGLLGYSWTNQTSVDTNITINTQFRQDWPYTGLASQVTTGLPGYGDAGIMKQVTNTYSCLDPSSGNACAVAPGNRYFPYNSQKLEASWELNGATFPSITTKSSFDTYGNALQVSVWTSDDYCKVTQNTYLPADTTHWYLGRLARTTLVSKTPPDGATCP